MKLFASLTDGPFALGIVHILNHRIDVLTSLSLMNKPFQSALVLFANENLISRFGFQDQGTSPCSMYIYHILIVSKTMRMW